MANVSESGQLPYVGCMLVRVVLVWQPSNMQAVPIDPGINPRHEVSTTPL